MKKWAFIIPLLLLFGGGRGLMAQEMTEYDLKALFIYNFTKYIEWTSTDNLSDFKIGVLGKDSEILPPLNAMAEKKEVNGKPIRILAWDNASEMEPCHILFISKDYKDKLEEVVEAMEGSNVLLVCESKGMAKSGAAINFIRKSEKIKFELNPTELEVRELKASSHLLRLAIIVNGS